jgi:hypothetical protein
MAKIAPLPSADVEGPRVLTPDELRFDIEFALKQIPRGLLRDWASTNDLKSAMARELMATTILARFDRYQVRPLAPLQAPFWNIGNQ